MAMDTVERTQFVNSYTRALISAWSSEAFAARLDSDPKGALAEAGLEIPADGDVVVVRTIPEGREEGNLDLQVNYWDIGKATGHYEIHIPETPQIDMAELNEGDLEAVAAGGDSCCCPCSCCT